jgi:hypothetical protein
MCDVLKINDLREQKFSGRKRATWKNCQQFTRKSNGINNIGDVPVGGWPGAGDVPVGGWRGADPVWPCAGDVPVADRMHPLLSGAALAGCWRESGRRLALCCSSCWRDVLFAVLAQRWRGGGPVLARRAARRAVLCALHYLHTMQNAMSCPLISLYTRLSQQRVCKKCRNSINPLESTR